MNSSKEHFLEVINEHQGIITNLCIIYYPCVEDQQDARQDIILQLWKSFSSFRGESKISTWIYKVSLHTILSKIRKERRTPYKETIGLHHRKTLVHFDNSDDDLQVLNQLIQSLKDLDKAIVVLYLEGYKNKETAQLLGLSSSNVSTRLNRIKTQLKSKFKTYSHEPK